MVVYNSHSKHLDFLRALLSIFGMWTHFSAILQTFSCDGHTSQLFCRLCSNMLVLCMFEWLFGFEGPWMDDRAGNLGEVLYYLPLLLFLTSSSWPSPSPPALASLSWPDQTRPILDLCPRPRHASRLKSAGGLQLPFLISHFISHFAFSLLHVPTHIYNFAFTMCHFTFHISHFTSLNSHCCCSNSHFSSFMFQHPLHMSNKAVLFPISLTRGWTV